MAGSGCIPNCVACSASPPILPASKLAETARRWERLRRELADPHSKGLSDAKG